MKEASALGIRAENVRITPARLRSKLWRIVQQMLEAQAKLNSAEFLSVPPESLTEDQCLKPEYCGTDATHAGSAYGQLALRYIAANA